MRIYLALTVFAVACAGDDTVAVPSTLSYEPGPSAGIDDDNNSATEPDAGNQGTPLDGLPSDVVSPTDAESPVDTQSAPPDLGTPDVSESTPDIKPPPAPDAGPVDEGWNPDWVENAPPETKGCLEAFPLICDKVAECGETQPLLGLVSGFCPTLFDAINPVLSMGCEQVGTLLDQAVPGGIPFIGDISDVVEKLLKGCIENFQCDPEYLAEFGKTLSDIGTAFAESQQAGGQADFNAVLPALLDLANQCGGIGDLLGIPFFGL